MPLKFKSKYAVAVLHAIAGSIPAELLPEAKVGPGAKSRNGTTTTSNVAITCFTTK